MVSFSLPSFSTSCSLLMVPTATLFFAVFLGASPFGKIISTLSPPNSSSRQ
ncbi:hypothetical protein 2011_scaffold13_00012 [Bacteriophage sp.]|nr:hypothetical protein 2011_scaffold13_00012 [Bacteriophage sp.]